MHVLRSDSNLYEFFYVLKQEVSVGEGGGVGLSSYWQRKIINDVVICARADEK